VEKFFEFKGSGDVKIIRRLHYMPETAAKDFAEAAESCLDKLKELRPLMPSILDKASKGAF
jgi:hypothetical protein